MSWLDVASIDASVLMLRPDYRAMLIVAEGLRPGPSDAVSDAILRDAEEQARAALGGQPPEALEPIEQWRTAYRAFGAKPQRTRPSVEALLRRLDAGLPRVDRLTDAYNAVSIGCLLPIGGEDLAGYIGPARLTRAVGDEPFETNSSGEAVVEHPDAGEVIWRDDAGVTCRRWNWRQCTRTRITESTTSAVFILDGLAALGVDGLLAAGVELTQQLSRLSSNARFTSRLLDDQSPTVNSTRSG
jgi:DNA/RNA-binding domain of Phe-tRNA-synthetase-like protein